MNATAQVSRQRRATAARTRARRLAMQALYQWQMTGQPPEDIEAQFRASDEFLSADEQYFHALLQGVVETLDDIDAVLAPVLDRALGEVDPVERAILRLAGFELLQRPEVPARVAISEAVNLARKYGAEQGHQFINGVLDRIARQVRAAEFGA